jgi:hypothetical protein
MMTAENGTAAYRDAWRRPTWSGPVASGGRDVQKSQEKQAWNNYTNPATGVRSNIKWGDLAPNPGHSRDTANWGWCRYIDRMWYLPTLMDALGTCKSIHSPCDPKTQRNNDTQGREASAVAGGVAGWGVREAWGNQNIGYNRVTKKKEAALSQAHMDRRGQSYAHCLGGDLLLPETIVHLTRNVGGHARRLNGKDSFTVSRTDQKPKKRTLGRYWSGAYQRYDDCGDYHRNTDLFHASSGHWQNAADPTLKAKASTWKNGKTGYAEDQGEAGRNIGHFMMAGLDMNQGNFARADGSSVQGSDSELLSAVNKHKLSEGGTLTTNTGTTARPATD